MNLRVVAGVLGGMIAAFASVCAQSSGVAVRGVAFDSLRSAPLEGAFVRMAGRGSARTTTSDARGEFSFDSVPPGTYTFSMLHAALDSLGFSGISVRAAVGEGGSSVRLSIPSFATLWRAACGAGPVPHDTGFVFGTVRDAERQTPLAGASVLVRWIALGVDASASNGAAPSVTEQAWGGEVRSDSTGGYTLCGVPSDATLRVLARKDSSSSGLVELLPHEDKHPRVERRDLSLGPVADSSATKRGIVAGLVRDANGNAVGEARVVTVGAEEVRSGADGRFVLANVPIGTREIEVLSIGAQPVVAATDVTVRDTAFVSIELRKIVELPAVVVTAKTARQRMLAEYEERKALRIGQFMDSTRVANFRTITDALKFLDFGCSVWIDGVRYRDDWHRELYARNSSSIAMIETHAYWDPSMPFRYRDREAMRCGVTLVWTKNWLP